MHHLGIPQKIIIIKNHKISVSQIPTRFVNKHQIWKKAFKGPGEKECPNQAITS